MTIEKEVDDIVDEVVLIKLSDFSEQYVQYTHIKCGL